MAVKRVNPNRMELQRLKNQLKTARRGHKLLKDKRDELMRQFLLLVKETEQLRLQAERLLSEAGRELHLATALLSGAVMEMALLSGQNQAELEYSATNIMSVLVPEFTLPSLAEQRAPRLPYSFASAGGELDQAVLALQTALPTLIKLASKEKQTELLAKEIEVCRRRVNSLEFRLIPDLQEGIRSISMKMDENERGNLTRLMKVKELILAQAGRIDQEVGRKRGVYEEH